jgi:uncharacterized cofD-like protein
MKKKIVTIGGGTGNFVVLSGLKKYYQSVDISTVVDMTDSGGSNRKLIDEFGLLPTSDIKQCLVALSPDDDSNSTLRKLFNYRFVNGEGIKGHHFGNLFMAALSDILGSQKKAIEKTQEILKIRGKIIPVSYEKADLSAEYDNGKIIVGEHLIDEPETIRKNLKIKRLFTTPEVNANPAALEAIRTADLIILCPGDLYTSVLANMVVDGIAEEVTKSKAKKAYVINLMTKTGQTSGFKASDHIKVVENYIGKSLNYVLINNVTIPNDVLEIYAKENEVPVFDDLNESYFKTVRSDFLNDKIIEQNQADVLKRSLVRHDSEKLANELIKLI